MKFLTKNKKTADKEIAAGRDDEKQEVHDSSYAYLCDTCRVRDGVTARRRDGRDGARDEGSSVKFLI